MTFAEMPKLPNSISRLYLDTNIFIYLLEGNADFSDRVEAVFLQAAQSGVTLVTSEFAICECLVGAYRRDDQKLIMQYEAFFSEARETLDLIEANSEILSHAPKIAGSLRLKLLDALHVSAALVSGCDGFLTNDAGITSIVGQLEVVPLSES